MVSIEKNAPILKAFISYSRKDLEIADALVAALEEEGIEVKIDRRDLPYGVEWQGELSDFIRSADTVIWLVSENSVSSKWCNWELGEVARLSKKLVPLRIGPVAPEELPEALGRIHLLPAEGTFKVEEHVDSLIETLCTDRLWIKTHTRLAERAREWLASDRRTDHLLRGAALKNAEIWLDARPSDATSPSDETLDLILSSRRASSRRQRRTLTAAILSSLVFAGIAGAAVYFWDSAEQSRETAVQAADSERSARKDERAARQRAEKERNSALVYRSRSLSTVAEEAIANGDAVKGALIAIEALEQPEGATGWVYPSRAEGALYRALISQREREVLSLDSRYDTLRAAFNDDGSRIVATSFITNDVGVWNLDGEQVAIVHHPEGRVRVSGAPQMVGETLLTYGQHRNAVIWDASRERQIERLAPLTPYTWDKILKLDYAPVLSRDGRFVLAFEKHQAEIIDARSGELIGRLEQIEDVHYHMGTISPDGSLVALAVQNGTIGLWSTPEKGPIPGTGELVKALDGHDAPIRQLRFSQDGERLVSIDDNHTLKVWNVVAGELQAEFVGHRDTINAFTLNGDGTLLATASHDGTGRVWDIEEDQPLSELKGHLGPVVGVGFLDEDQTVATASEDGTIHLWETGNGRPIRTLRGHTDEVETLGTHPTEDLILSGGDDGTARLWSRHPIRLKSFRVPGEFEELVYRRDSKRLAIHTKQSVFEYDLETEKRADVISDLSDDIIRIGYAADPEILFVVFADGRIEARDTSTGEVRFSRQATPDTVASVATISQDGRFVAVAAGSGSIQLWDMSSDEPALVLVGHSIPPSKLTFAGDGKFLLSGSIDGSNRLWDVNTGKQIRAYEIANVSLQDPDAKSPGERVHEAITNVTTLREVFDASDNERSNRVVLLDHALHPDGKLLVTSYGNRVLTYWDVETGEREFFRGTENIDNIAFDQTGRYLLLAQGGISEAIMQTVDVKTDKREKSFVGHESGIEKVSFDPTGQRLLSLSYDKTVRLWDVAKGDEILTLAQSKSGFSEAMFSPDSRTIAVYSDDGEVTIYPHYGSAEELMALAKSELPRCLTQEERHDLILDEDYPPWCRGRWPYLARHSYSAGDESYKYEKYDRAVARFTEAIERVTDATDQKSLLSDAYFGRALANFKKENWDAAVSDWRKAADLGHRRAERELWWARWRSVETKIDAGKVVEGLIESWIRHVDVPDSVVMIDFATARDEAIRRLAYPVARAYNMLHQAGSDATKITACDKLASHKWDPFRVSGATRVSEINASEAIEACSAAIRENPTNPRYRLNRARAFSKAAEDAKAKEDQGEETRYRLLESTDLHEAAEMPFAGLDGYPMAANNLGYRLNNGQGVEVDKRNASLLYAQMYNRVLQCCATRVARHIFSDSVRQEEENVRIVIGAMLRQAATVGSADAHRLLAELYASGWLQPDGPMSAAQSAFMHASIAEKVSRKIEPRHSAVLALSRATRKSIASLAKEERSKAMEKVDAWKPAPDTQLPPWLGPERRDSIVASLQSQTVSPQTGHTNYVTALAVSKDGAILASAAEDGLIKLWDPDSGHLLRTLYGKGGRVSAIAFSVDGTHLATGDWLGHIYWWNVRSGRLEQTFEGHGNWVKSLAISPNGDLMASASTDSTIRLWDLSDARAVRTIETLDSAVNAVAFSPNGDRLASGSADGVVRIWNVADGELVKEIPAHEDEISALTYSPDGQYLVSSAGDLLFGEDNEVKVWDPLSGELIRSVSHSPNAVAIAGAPSNSHFLTAGGNLLREDDFQRDGYVALWEAKTGEIIWSRPVEYGPVTSVAFFPDRERVVTGGADGSIEISNARDGARVRLLTGENDNISAIAISEDGSRLASGSSNGVVRIWDLLSGRLLHTLYGHGHAVTSLEFSPDGTRLVSGAYDHLVKLWDPIEGKIVFTMSGHDGAVNAVSISPDGRLLVSGGSDRRALVWFVEDGSLFTELAEHDKSITAVDFSPDSTFVTTASADHTVKLWSPTTGEVVRTFEGHEDRVNTVVFSPDGLTVASGDDRDVRLWDIATAEELRTCRGHEHSLIDIAFDEDTDQLISVDVGGTRIVWEADGCGKVDTRTGTRGSRVTIADAGSQTGLRVVVFGHEIHLIESKDDQPVARLIALPNDEWIAIAQSGRYAASPDAERYVRLTDGMRSTQFLGSKYNRFLRELDLSLGP